MLGIGHVRNISWFRISTFRKYAEHFGYWSICEKNSAVFGIDSSFLCRLQLSLSTVRARFSFRALLRHVTITLSPLQVKSLASSEANIVKY